jgi:hypothetical protein
LRQCNSAAQRNQHRTGQNLWENSLKDKGIHRFVSPAPEISLTIQPD